MAENPCWKGYEQIGNKKKNGKSVPNCVPIKRAKNLSTIEEQTQKIKDAALALVEQANSEFSGTRVITHKAAVTVIERSLVKNEAEPFSVRKHRAIAELSQYITLAQHNRVLNGLPEHTDLLPVAHPRSTRAHDMTTANLMKSRARWVTDDPSIQDATVKTLIASALTAHPASAEYEYAVARLESFPAGKIPQYALLAALGDGNSSLARRARAMRQRRDRKGRFAEMGGGLRALIRRVNGMVQNLNGRAVSQGIEGDTFDFETPDGKLFRVPAGNVEAIKATIPSQQTKDGYAKNPAKVSAKDPVINEADLVEVDAPEGFRRDDAWSPKQEDRDIYGENVDLGVKYTDDAYDVIKMENNQYAKDQFEVAQQREREGQNVVAQGEGANGELDPNKPVYLVGRRGQDDERPFAAVQSWAEVQDFIGQDEPRFEKNENPKPDRMGGGDDGGDEPPTEPVAELPAEDGDKKFPEGTQFIGGTDKPSRSEMREYRKQLKDFRKNGGLLPLDPRKNWAILPDGSVVDADSGEILRDNQQRVNLPEDEPGLVDRIKARLAPQGAYEVDRDEYQPEGPIDGQESPDFTDDPAELAQKFDQEELQESLKDAVEGTPEDPATGVGRLPFQEGDERVPAEALYNALKEQGVDVDKFLDDLYKFNQEAKAKQAPADADVVEAPVAKISDKELPPLIEGMTPEEQRDFIDNGDYKKYLPKNVEHDVPEGYAGLSNDPFNAAEAPVPADAPEGFSNDPVDIALGYDKEELKGELRRAIEPGGDMPGQGLLAQETPEGEEYVASVPGEAIRDALQLQGEDTNALIQDIYDEGKDNEPSNQEIADALEGENVQEEPTEAPQQAPQDAQGPDAAEPEAGLPADNQPQGTEGRAEAAEGVERLGSQEADLAMGEPRREMVRAADLQPGDIAVRDNEFFVIDEVPAPAELSERGQKDKKRNRIAVKGHYPGHQVQERNWFANGEIEVIRGVAAPEKGDAPALDKPELADFGKMKKFEDGWGLADPAAQAKYDAELAAHKAAVQAAGADFVDPTKAESEGPVAQAILADAMPAGDAPIIAKFKASDLQVGDITVKDHFRITNITRGEDGKILVEGHYPGQGLQTKQWWPNTGIEVIRGIPEDQAPQLGEGSLHRPAGRGPKGGWFPIDDTALNAEHEAKIAEAKARWEAPADLPIVSAAQAKNDDPLEDNIKLPPKPREPAYPAFMGKFAEWAKEAQGNWAEFKKKLAGQDLIVFDFETTGLDAKDGNEPWQIAAVKMRDGKVIDRINIFMNPGKSVKDTFAGKHAKDPDGNPLTDEFFADKPTQAEGLQQFLDWAGANPLAIAQNAKFDDEVMKRKAAELGLNWEPAGMADTMGMAAEIFKDAPGAPDRKGLGAIADFLEIKNENWHDGLNDAEVTAEAFTKLIDLAAEGNFGVGALDADAQQAAYDAKMAELQPRIDEFNKAAADYVAKKALRDGLAGKPVDLAEIQKEIPAALPEGPIDNIGAMDNPEQVPAVQPDLVDVQVMSAFPDGKMRIAEPGWADDFENVDVLNRGQIHANSLRPGDFVHPKKDDPEFMQVVSIRGGEEFGVEEWKRRVVMQNAEGEQRVAIWNQNAFLDEVRRPKNRAALAGEPLPEVERTPEEMNMQAVSVARGNAVLEITPDGKEFVMKARLLDDSGNEIYAVEGRFLSPEGAEAEGKALLRRAGAEFADRQRTNEGQPASKAKSVAIGNEPANVDQLPVVEMVENLEVGEGQNEITPRVEEGNVIYKSDAKLVDEGDVIAQVVEDFPSKKEASEGGRNNVDAMAVAFAEKFALDREKLLLRSEGRGRRNLPPIPDKYRRQVYIRLLAGLYADRNGDPLAIGDKVIHQNPKLAKKYGEGEVVGKVQGNVGGLQRAGVVYVDYVWFKSPNFEKPVKLNARMLEHLDRDVAKERFDAEPKINWMNPEEKAQAVIERNKKPRKGGNEAIDEADAEVERIASEVEQAVAPAAPAPAVEPEAPVAEAPVENAVAANKEEVAKNFQLQGETYVRKNGNLVRLTLNDVVEGDFIMSRRGNFGRVIGLEKFKDAQGVDRIRMKVQYQNGDVFDYRPYRANLKLDGLWRIPNKEQPDVPQQEENLNEPSAPKVEAPVPTPAGRPIAQVIKDLAALKKELGFKKDANYRKALLIDDVNRALKALREGDVERFEAYANHAQKLLPRVFPSSSDEAVRQRYENVLQGGGFVADANAIPKFEFNGPALEDVDPIAVAEKRIADGENAVDIGPFWKGQLADSAFWDDAAARGVDARQFKDEIQAHFSGEAKPLAALQERARIALGALIADKMLKPKTPEDERNIKGLAELAWGLQRERIAMQPNSPGLDERGQFLLNNVLLADIQAAEKSPNKMLKVNGQEVGFKVKRTRDTPGMAAGGGRQGSNVVYVVTDTKTGKQYFFKKDTAKENVDAEMLGREWMEALGGMGVHAAERHPEADNLLVMDFAGKNLKLKKTPQLAADVAGDPTLAAKGNVAQNMAFVILDAIMNNNDRHGNNYLIAKDDNHPAELGGNEGLIALAIDNGVGAAIAISDRTNGFYDPMDFINGNRGRSSLQRYMLQALGREAFQEMAQISVQQAIQILRRKYPVGTNPQMDLLISRAEEIANATATDWKA